MGQNVIKPGSTPLVRHEIEYQPSRYIMQIPPNFTALYVLYAYDSETRHMNVRYVGYADKQSGDDVRDMLLQQQKLNGRMWSHFSVYELWDYFQKDDTKAVETLFEHVYRHDSHLKTHLAKNRRVETSDNVFIPKVLFVAFVNHISRVSTKIFDSEVASRGATAPMFES
jgi:hypothetical protein